MVKIELFEKFKLNILSTMRGEAIKPYPSNLIASYKSSKPVWMTAIELCIGLVSIEDNQYSKPDMIDTE